MQKARDWFKKEGEDYDAICYSLCMRFSGEDSEYYCDKYKTTIKELGPFGGDVMIMMSCAQFEKDNKTGDGICYYERKMK